LRQNLGGLICNVRGVYANGVCTVVLNIRALVVCQF
jgi:hypothetical protein